MTMLKSSILLIACALAAPALAQQQQGIGGGLGNDGIARRPPAVGTGRAASSATPTSRAAPRSASAAATSFQQGMSGGVGSEGVSSVPLPMGTSNPVLPACTGAVDLTTGCLMPMLGGL